MFVLLHHFYRYRLYHRRKFYQFIYIISFHRLISLSFSTYNILSGLLISPFVIAIFFVKSFAVIPLLKIVIFGAILLMIVKIIRWIEILITHRVSILYMILYLCALEIMPLLVLYKMVE